MIKNPVKMGSNIVELKPQIEIASHHASDTRTQSARDRPPSMSTVRFSNSSGLSIRSATSLENLPSAESARQSAQVPGVVSSEDYAITGEEACITIDETSLAAKDMEEEGGEEEDNLESCNSMRNFQEELVASASSTIRSRSDSSGSGASAQVDWEELEKSEEQAPRDEGSDEVSNLEMEHLP